MSFEYSQIQLHSISIFIKVILLGILCAVLSVVFCKVMHTAAALYRKYIPNDYLRIVAGGVIVVILTLLSGTRDYNGSGNLSDRLFLRRRQLSRQQYPFERGIFRQQ